MVLMSDFKARPLHLSEAQLQAATIDLAHAYGWLVAHFRPAQTAKGWRTAVAADGRGFPDLVLAKQGRVLFAELKASVGLLTDAQRKWLDELGPDAYLWTPKSWSDGSILATLSGGTK
jgi:hypothetical protein